MIRFYFFLVVLLVTQCQPADRSIPHTHKFDDPKLQKLYDLQDQRSAAELLLYLSDDDSLIRKAAAEAFASVQDPQSKASLIELLEDPITSVRSAAAYATGQLFDTTLQEALIQYIAKESSPQVLNQLFEALGKCSTKEKGLAFLSKMPADDPQVASGIAWGIYRAGLKGVHSAAAVATATQLLSSKNAEAQLGAAHFLARTRGLQLSDQHQELLEASSSNNPEVRMAIALALGKSSFEAQEPLLRIIQEDPDYRVRVNAIRALSGFPTFKRWEVLLEATQDVQAAVGLTAAQFLKDFAPESIAPSLKELALTTPHKRVGAALWAAALKHSTVKANLTETLQREFTESTDPYYRAYILQALAENVHSYPFLQAALLGDYAPVVNTEAMNSLFTINRHPEFNPQWKPDFISIYREAIASGDVAIMGIAAQALRHSPSKYEGSFEDLGFLDEALAGLKLPRDVETYLELQRTKNYLSNNTQPIPVDHAYNNPVDWQVVSQIPKGQRINIQTSRGEIQMELLVEESPATVAYIWSLMESGFYKEKTFHRVVPNFVAQGGCPRGDGWGSTELSLRSELGPLRYATGSVGIASAGKDTEGCQWFITHSPTPHLDGRYTIFAKITKGMEVVHQLQPGDKIQEIVKEDVQEI